VIGPSLSPSDGSNDCLRENSSGLRRRVFAQEDRSAGRRQPCKPFITWLAVLLHTKHSDRKKAGLYGGHAEALTLRQAILETQPAKPTQNDPLVCRLVGILYFTVLAVVMIGWVWLLFEGFTWALA
jgi:hypothetical protein